ncbi:unnamed protein product [Pelagomonas calceolata]|uniref:Uncharacterized protein n=1 Tax=Pelagomonas calceolata TaxID=35677 RepID=A0A8J2WUT8_9STRA|nr:unnamed protein product [Pelagomonas calceolata]|mmetsp:Transcript_6631/g.18589  ORF Transcript_6631/g.18589 Transcript_6631/m.18589 type:complete len:222 (+) Transcript_6631:70-735(+)
MIGTPGIFRSRFFKSLSHVATMKHLWTRQCSTISSSAYVPRFKYEGILRKRGSFASLKANRYFVPSFSSSAMTLSSMTGTHFASKQSVMPLTRSILFLIEKLMKFVSTITWKGGPRPVLCAKNMEAGVWSTWRSACFFFFSSFFLTRSCLSLRRGSCFGFTVRLMARTLAARNFLALPIVTLELFGARGVALHTLCKWQQQQLQACYRVAGANDWRKAVPT